MKVYLHDYKPEQYVLHGSAPYLGVELEIDGVGGNYGENAASIFDAAGIPRDETVAYVKEDGSLHAGIEIVTHPGGIEWHLQEFPWRELCKAAKELGYRSHDAGTCGLHVHVCKEAFGQGYGLKVGDRVNFSVDGSLLTGTIVTIGEYTCGIRSDEYMPYMHTLRDRVPDGYGWYDHLADVRPIGASDSERDINLMKLLFLFEKYWSNFVRFSRRTNRQLREWAWRYNDCNRDDPKDIYERAKQCGRYHAVNIHPSRTVEFRIFRGTLNCNTIFATLQLCTVLVDLVTTRTVQEVIEMPWSAIRETGAARGYDELISYLDKRGL